MKKVTVKKASNAKNAHKSFSKPSAKLVGEFQFWEKVALEQQMLIHAKNNT